MTLLLPPGDAWLWLELLWVLGMSAWILLERRPPLATLSWILGLSLLPVVGIPVYYFLGPRSLRRRQLRRRLARTAVARSRPRAMAELLENAATLREEIGDVGAAVAQVALAARQGPPLTADAVRLYDRGSDAYDAILAAIDGARHHIHLEYYIIERGRVADRLRDALLARCREGVTVRLLLDGLGTGAMDGWLAPLRAAGVRVARFNPRNRPGFLNFRTHRKIVVVDGRCAFTGGMNVADAHDERIVGEAAAWRDTQIRLDGDAAVPLQIAFLEDWHYATDEWVEGEGYLPGLTGTGTIPVQVLASGPDIAEEPIRSCYMTAIGLARHRLWITTPYFVPDEPLELALRTAAMRGVDVRVLVPADSDHRFVDAAAASYFPELLAAGVRVYRYGPPALHAKTMVVDAHIAIVGSANFDNRSFRLNFEASAAVFAPAAVEALAAMFETDLAHAARVTHDRITNTSIPTRLLQGVARLMSPML
ncbi:MAG: cardiolipin synthase [Gemmatimonadaceae bacterium]|nr:cardiolipin synthase [Gemmatimonadaceae bacterium]